MPTDEKGNRADIIIYGDSRVKRMNWGSLNEHFRNAAGRDLTQRLRRTVGLDIHREPTSFQAQQATQDAAFRDWAFAELMALYDILAPLTSEMLRDEDENGRARHVASVLCDGVYYYIPPDNPVNDLDAMRQIRDSRFCPHYGPVTYRNQVGEMVTTDKSVLIGSIYIILLEKTGEDWSAVASTKSNHFGVPAKLTNFDKYASPGRNGPVRGIGESESRAWVSYVGPQPTAEMIDIANNAKTHRAAVETLLTVDKPTNIERITDRNEIPYGHARPVEFVNHTMECQGLRFVYHPPE